MYYAYLYKHFSYKNYYTCMNGAVMVMIVLLPTQFCCCKLVLAMIIAEIP